MDSSTLQSQERARVDAARKVDEFYTEGKRAASMLDEANAYGLANRVRKALAEIDDVRVAMTEWSS